jgi:hypothetical protein
MGRMSRLKSGAAGSAAMALAARAAASAAGHGTAEHRGVHW